MLLFNQSNPKGFVEINLAFSKSESNRALIMQALAQFQSQTSILIQNISTARDTQTLQKLLVSDEKIANVWDAGTTMRFLTAFFAITHQSKILTGTPRMCERPIGILVDALRAIGFQISYVEKENFPPIEIHSSSMESLQNKVSISAQVSSQYISALLMIAPLLPKGLELHLVGKISSRPYIEMTLRQMEQFGIRYTWQENIIYIPTQLYQSAVFQVESDWSGASYWYSVVALAEDLELLLKGLKKDSLQGDSQIQQIMQQFGVESQFTEKGVLIRKRKTSYPLPLQNILIDFTTCPDLAQTVIAYCAIEQIKAQFKGLESLRIKETDRILALQNEIAKVGAALIEIGNEMWELTFTPFSIGSPISIRTYEDHRMAMAFAPWATRYTLEIENPDVVQKSYPHFWEDFKQVMETSLSGENGLKKL